MFSEATVFGYYSLIMYLLPECSDIWHSEATYSMKTWKIFCTFSFREGHMSMDPCLAFDVSLL